MPPNLLTPRARILAHACRLFYSQGVRATGIDQIIAEAAVAKATFYYHFSSKMELVSEYLRQRHIAWISEFSGYLAKTRRRDLLALADALEYWFHTGDFNGCAFINVTAESADEHQRQISCAHKEALQTLIERLLGDAVIPGRRAKIAARALVVVEGMIVRFQMTHDATVVEHGRELLKLLLADAKRCCHLPRA